MALREGGEEHPYRLISDSVPNLYNMVTVIAVLCGSWGTATRPSAAT